jgi:small subunit ribosomal protein S8
MMNDTLASVMSAVSNAEKIAKKELTVTPISKTIKKVLEIMQANLYVGSFTEIEDTKGNLLKINLLGSINSCGAIKPRYAVKKEDYEKFEKRYLPAKDFGILIVSTSQGLMTHIEAKKKGIGGKLIAFCY